MSGESDEVEVKVPGRRVPDLSLDEKTFILLQKSEKATYKQMVLNAPAGLQISELLQQVRDVRTDDVAELPGPGQQKVEDALSGLGASVGQVE